MKQKYELGQKVWAFKQQGKELVKMTGVIQSADLDQSGFVFYKVAFISGDEVKSVMANHASIALSEVELDKKMEIYHKFQEEQKALFEQKIGAPEFTPNYIETELTKEA